MKRITLLVTLVGLALTGCMEPVRQDVEALEQGRETPRKDPVRQDIEALKQSQEALLKDMAEIKKLLQIGEEQPVAQALDKVLEISGAPLKGSQDAKLTLIEFSDYQCPFCKRHAEETLSQIDKEYIATGKLRYVFRDFPLEMHKQALKAAEAAHCADEQGKYWEIHDQLFANQQALKPKQLTRYARAVGLKAGPFKKCLDSGKYAEQVRKDMAEGQKLGISGTPTLMLGVSNGDKVENVKMIQGAHPFPTFKEEIDKLLKGSDQRAENN
jgi:protein-disulfide isomerase